MYIECFNLGTGCLMFYYKVVTKICYNLRNNSLVFNRKVYGIGYVSNKHQYDWYDEL